MLLLDGGRTSFFQPKQLRNAVLKKFGCFGSGCAAAAAAARPAPQASCSRRHLPPQHVSLCTEFFVAHAQDLLVAFFHPLPMSAAAAGGGDAEEQLFAQLQVLRTACTPSHDTTSSRFFTRLSQDVPSEQLMQIRKQVQEEAQYFNESFQQLRMAQS